MGGRRRGPRCWSSAPGSPPGCGVCSAGASTPVAVMPGAPRCQRSRCLLPASSSLGTPPAWHALPHERGSNFEGKGGERGQQGVPERWGSPGAPRQESSRCRSWLPAAPVMPVAPGRTARGEPALPSPVPSESQPSLGETEAEGCCWLAESTAGPAGAAGRGCQGPGGPDEAPRGSRCGGTSGSPPGASTPRSGWQ